MSNSLLTVNIAGMNLGSPTALASGILGYTAESLRLVAEGGAGAVVTKSVGVAPRPGYPNPTVVQADSGLINAVGLPNPGIDFYVEELTYAKSLLPVPLIVSVFGYTAEEYALVSKKAVEAGADAVELNVSCPHVKYTGSEIGQNPKLLTDVVCKVKAAVQKPVIVKLSPNVTDITELAKAAENAGADALTVINTVRAVAINVETQRAVLSNIRGGLSGPAIKPIALRCVYDVFEAVKLPIFGCGGITDWRDAVEFFLAGASAVQVGTAVGSEDPTVFQAINRGVASYLKRKAYGSVNEIVGLCHQD
ncbi:MAG: dihydroorotate dehydrogenase [Candidatus Bathyarchaeota archaeon]|nr:dihydroorotate dehydrogenase [Candidatus Bathyarchaeota archaeon]